LSNCKVNGRGVQAWLSGRHWIINNPVIPWTFNFSEDYSGFWIIHMKNKGNVLPPKISKFHEPNKLPKTISKKSLTNR
jgi:hypothetical protein